MTLADPFARLLSEIRADAGVIAIASTRVGPEAKTGWALGPDAYQPFVLLTTLGRSAPGKHCPTQEGRYLAKCYGATRQGARELAGAVSSAIHDKGFRTSSAGVRIFTSYDDGGDPGEDPQPPNGNGQPYETVIISVGSLTSLLP